jgi:hypothetical protein
MTTQSVLLRLMDAGQCGEKRGRPQGRARRIQNIIINVDFVGANELTHQIHALQFVLCDSRKHAMTPRT